jgi:hypothetical protein
MAEGIQNFAIKTIGLSGCNGRKPCDTPTAARHILREIQAELGTVGRIDAGRMGSNIIMQGPPTAALVQAHADELLALVDTARLKRDHVQAIEAVFSLPAGAGLDPLAYFARCLEWLRVALPLPVLLAVVHMDEAAPHMHALLLPVEGGRHVGGALIDRAQLRTMRESFFTQVAGPAGLKRHGAKVRGMVKRWAVDAVLAECEALGLPAVNGPLWTVWRDAIERDPTAALLALGIDANTIRPKDKGAPSPVALAPSPIALAPSPIALCGAIERGAEKRGVKIEGLSCVALAQPDPQKFTQKIPPDGVHGLEKPHQQAAPVRAIDTPGELWAAVGCRSLWRKPTDTERARLHRLAIARATQANQRASERLQTARGALAHAQTKQTHMRPDRPPAAPASREDEGEVVRIRDEYAHECPWD